MPCSTVLVAIGRGPNSFLQEKAGFKTGKRNSITTADDFKPSINCVFAAGDVTRGKHSKWKPWKKDVRRLNEFMDI